MGDVGQDEDASYSLRAAADGLIQAVLIRDAAWDRIVAIKGPLTEADRERSAFKVTEQRVVRELADDQALPGDLHPFGNEIGEQIKSTKTAWRLTCARAGIKGLTFRDLRRESGSRLLETPGVSLTDVRDYLGHKNATMTNTYLASTTLRLRDALKKRDTARTFLAQEAEAASEQESTTTVTH